MALKSNIEWKFWGDYDPLFAVAACKGRNKDGENPWTDEEFYELGRKDWADFIEHWTRYGVDNKVCVEIGCGAGRLTKQMAGFFSRVHALDVSEGMLSRARKNIQDPRIEFQLVEGNTIPAPDNSVNAVFSTHVFQHLDELEDATTYFKEISRVLVPGGTMMIHIPVHAWPLGAGRWVRRVYRINKLAEDIRAKWRRTALKKGQFKHLMRMHSYPIQYFYELLPTLNFSDIEISVFVTKSNNGPHPFVMARKNHLSGTSLA